ncbi:MAG: DUF928 domain-containing protein [Methylococcales bacterium]
MQYFPKTITIISLLVFTSYTIAEEAKTADSKQNTPELSNHHNKNNPETPNTKVSSNNVAFAEPVVYDLPDPGAPETSRLIGAGTRTKGERTPYMSVLTPKHTGLTLEKQPTLYWFTSEPITIPLQFVLISEQSFTPILRVPLLQPQHAGIQSIKLSDYNVSLKPETVYQWSVALISNPEMRTHDMVTSGKIKRIETAKSLQHELSQTPETSRPSVYARHGIWYDLLSCLANSIATMPTDQFFKETRAQLLEQVGLREVAHYERK